MSDTPNDDVDNDAEAMWAAARAYLTQQSRHFCILPWMHLFGEPDGKLLPCCVGNRATPVGDASKQTLEDAFNSAPMRAMRRAMLEGRPSVECAACYRHERVGAVSHRMNAMRKFREHIDWVRDTAEDGSAPFRLAYWDFRFSNVCNMRCRSCSPVSSSRLHDEWEAIYGAKPMTPRLLRLPDRVLQELEAQYDDLVAVNFAGGEPLIMDAHYQILDELRRRDLRRVAIHYNTNFSRLTHKSQDVLDYWRDFDSVNVHASLDAMGARAELMRPGAAWADIEANRRRLSAEAPHVRFNVAATLGIVNAAHIVDFHRNWVERELLKPQAFSITLLLEPHWQRLDVAPPDYRAMLTERFEAHLAWLDTVSSPGVATVSFRAAIEMLAQGDHTDQLQNFRTYTERYDRARGETTRDVFPELAPLLD